MTYASRSMEEKLMSDRDYTYSLYLLWTRTADEKVRRSTIVIHLIADHRSSRAREFHPHPLTEPCVKVSPHTALHTQRFVHIHNLGV